MQIQRLLMTLKDQLLLILPVVALDRLEVKLRPSIIHAVTTGPTMHQVIERRSLPTGKP